MFPFAAFSSVLLHPVLQLEIFSLALFLNTLSLVDSPQNTSLFTATVLSFYSFSLLRICLAPPFGLFHPLQLQLNRNYYMLFTAFVGGQKFSIFSNIINKVIILV
jgi:hypothetical protein